MTELEIFLMASLENVLELHKSAIKPLCLCDQCRIARSALGTAKRERPSFYSVDQRTPEPIVIGGLED